MQIYLLGFNNKETHSVGCDYEVDLPPSPALFIVHIVPSVPPPTLFIRVSGPNSRNQVYEDTCIVCIHIIVYYDLYIAHFIFLIFYLEQNISLCFDFVFSQDLVSIAETKLSTLFWSQYYPELHVNTIHRCFNFKRYAWKEEEQC